MAVEWHTHRSIFRNRDFGLHRIAPTHDLRPSVGPHLDPLGFVRRQWRPDGDPRIELDLHRDRFSRLGGGGHHAGDHLADPATRSTRIVFDRPRAGPGQVVIV